MVNVLKESARISGQSYRHTKYNDKDHMFFEKLADGEFSKKDEKEFKEISKEDGNLRQVKLINRYIYLLRNIGEL